MRRTSFNLIKLIFVSATLVLIFLSYISYTRMTNLIDSSELVNHTNEVNLDLANVLNYFTAMETSQRGFLLTKDSVFIQSFNESETKVDLYLNKVDSLTKDNKAEQDNIILLRKLIAERKVYLNDLLVNDFSAKKVLAGRKLWLKAKDQIDLMSKQEDFLLNQRLSAFNKEVFLNPLVISFIVLVTLLILFGAYYKIINDLKRSDELKSELEKTNIQLQQKNKSLIESEERLFKMFDNNPVAMTFGEISTNKIIYANNLFYSSFGLTHDEVIGHTSEELKLVSDEENQRLIMIIMSYLDEDRSVAELQALPADERAKLLIKLREKMFSNGFEVLYSRRNGTSFYAMVFFEVIKIGNEQYALSSYQDITNRKQIEELLEKKNKELKSINRELESFTYISSHDLQEPVRKIQTLTSRIIDKEKQNLSDSGKDYLTRIENAAERMQMLIKDLLAYSRLNGEKEEPETADLNIVLDEVITDLREIIEEKNATLEVGPMCPAKVIPFQFRQLMTNIITNALKFSKLDVTPHIKIKSVTDKGNKLNNELLLPDKNYCHLHISDNGIGFDPQYQERIFEVFQRLGGKDQENIKGSGIGLAIVKRIVENHNGIITATSKVGEGAQFDIYIPAE